jgi:type I restriction enzyme M protein
MPTIREIANFLWEIADEILRDDFKRSKYPDVILPFVVLRRLDCVLKPTKAIVLERREKLAKSCARPPAMPSTTPASTTSSPCWTIRRTSART